jgi:hypothetical protein
MGTALGSNETDVDCRIPRFSSESPGSVEGEKDNWKDSFWRGRERMRSSLGAEIDYLRRLRLRESERGGGSRERQDEGGERDGASSGGESTIAGAFRRRTNSRRGNRGQLGRGCGQVEASSRVEGLSRVAGEGQVARKVTSEREVEGVV